MMGALLYLHFVGMKNRLWMRVKRLKQPKYLLGAIAGGAYLYFYFFRFLFLGSRSGPGQSAHWFTPENQLLIECGAALLLCAIVLLAWIVPNKRAALAFTEAEIAFLFPAPVTRRTLIQFKLLRSQLAILFTIVILTLISRRAGSNMLVRALGWWMVLSALNLHFMAVSFLRTRLMDRGMTSWSRRIGILAAVIVAGAAVGAWLWSSLPAGGGKVDNPEELLDRLRAALTTGALPMVLYPFRLMVRPLFAQTFSAFLTVVWPALLILAAHYWWVIRSDVAFEEASVEASRKLAERIALARAGRGHAKGRPKVRRAPFTLKPSGSPAVALLWKNLIGTGQFFSARLWIMLCIIALFMASGMVNSTASGGLIPILGILALMFLVWSILLGPQLLAQDMRQDLKMADLLKTYPLNGWQVVLGELLAPAAILTGVQWLLIPLAGAGLLKMAHAEGFTFDKVAGFAVAVALLAPSLNLLSLIIPNAAALIFPAWMLPDKTGPHGIETTGQRIILLIGQMLVLMVSALPAVAVFTVVLLAVKWAAGWLMAAPLAGLAASATLLGEVSVAVLLLGRFFERLDLSAELSA